MHRFLWFALLLTACVGKAPLTLEPAPAGAGGSDGGAGGMGGSAGGGPGCVHPDAETLAMKLYPGTVDLAFDAECRAYLPTVVSGQDRVYVTDGATTDTILGMGNFNLSAVGIDPVRDIIFVAQHTDNSICHLAAASSNSAFSTIATGVPSGSDRWHSAVLQRCQTSIAVDSRGCVWVPNFDGAGTLSCIRLEGEVSTEVTGQPYIESVALDHSEEVFFAADELVKHYDRSSKEVTTIFTAGAPVLDFAFAPNGELFVETTAGVIERRLPSGSSEVIDTVVGQGRLAVSPDGYLVRIASDTPSPASFVEWALPDL